MLKNILRRKFGSRSQGCDEVLIVADPQPQLFPPIGNVSHFAFMDPQVRDERRTRTSSMMAILRWLRGRSLDQEPDVVAWISDARPPLDDSEAIVENDNGYSLRSAPRGEAPDSAFANAAGIAR